MHDFDNKQKNKSDYVQAVFENIAVNSDILNGLSIDQAFDKIVEYLEENNIVAQ